MSSRSPRPTMSRDKQQSVYELEQELAILVRRIRRVVAERAREVHEDLQVAAYFVLAKLARTGSLRSADLVDEFGVDKGAISRQVHQLVDLGLVVKEPDPADGRAMMLSITDEGRRRLEDTWQHRRALLGERLAGWTEPELRDFVAALARYNRSLES